MENFPQHTSATIKDFPLSFLERITDNFSKERIIGRGGYGEVFKGILDNGEEIAVKKLYRQPGLDADQFKNELMNLMMAQHKNIIGLIGYCSEARDIVVEHNGKLVFASVEDRVLCLEYMQGGSLDKHISDESCGLGWDTRNKIIKGICEGLKYLHTGSKDPIYHLDLKPANILLDKDMIPKIGDFGLSRLLGTQTCVTSTFAGTRGYVPPEYIDGQQISPKFDVFSLGVIIIQVIAGHEAYYKCPDMTSQEFIDLVSENWLKWLPREGTSSWNALQEIQTCVKIALRCIEPKRMKRPTITEIVDELNMVHTRPKSPKASRPRQYYYTPPNFDPPNYSHHYSPPPNYSHHYSPPPYYAPPNYYGSPYPPPELDRFLTPRIDEQGCVWLSPKPGAEGGARRKF